MIRRVWIVLSREMGYNLARPLFWVWLVIFGFSVWGLANGNLQIAMSGDSSVGGNKQWLTSEFSLAQIFTAFNLLLSGFFIAVSAGLCVIRDEDLKIHPILLATGLSPREYIWGKFLGNTASIVIVLLVQACLAAAAFHWLPTARSHEIRGPFEWLNYLRPLCLFSLPMVMFLGGVSYSIGVVTRRPVLIFVLPTVLLIVFGMFLSSWSPLWLSNEMNRFLMLIDPYGFRWLRETWLKVDLGTAFYNTRRLEVDWGFAASRWGFLLLGLLSVAGAARRFAHTFRSVRQGSLRGKTVEPVSTEVAPATLPVALPAMRTEPPGFLTGLFTVARFETWMLLVHPGIYLFVPFIVLQTLGMAQLREGPFNTPMLLTPGSLAVTLMNTLTTLIVLLLLFFAMDAMERERRTELAPIFHSTALSTAALFFGKITAIAFLGGGILLITLLACLIMLAVQGTVPIDLGPFLLVWGGMLFPTFIFWSALVAFGSVISRNRYVVFAAAAGVLIYTFYRQFSGKMNWVGNWNLWSSTGWSDIARLELDAAAILANRVLYLSLSVLLVYASVRLFGRQAFDATRVVGWFRPAAIFRTLLRAIPLLVVPLCMAGVLWLMVWRGFEGEPAKAKMKDYWRQNVRTWTDTPDPALQHVLLDLDLQPQDRRFRAQGTYRLLNQHAKPMRQIALTGGPGWQEERWTLNGKTIQPEDRSRLLVFTLPEPLEPNQTLEIGFQYSGQFPVGVTKSGGGTSEFILPSSVVLTSFSPSFVPVIGYIEEAGVDKDNRQDSKQYDDHFYEGDTPPLFGAGSAFTTHVTLHGPSDFELNSVGALRSSQVDGERKTVVWESDHPVRFFNVVAGRWKVREGQHTKVFYDERHPYNVEEMGVALDAAYTYYSQWFRPYPWQELKLSEFANLATYAQGFPTNITFSEGIGFLTEDKPGANAAFLVTAHEAAHQWWGNLLVPGQGPGGNVLSEGGAHFSTGLLIEQVKGLGGRIEFFDGIEKSYNEARRADAERPLVKVDGSKDGDTTVMYDKGGWVFWMLLNHLGRERMLTGIQQFMTKYDSGSDYPVLQDFVAALRPLAPDPVAYDAFVKQWFLEVILPEFRWENVRCAKQGDSQWRVTGTLKNTGTGRVQVEVAATNGERFDEQKKPRSEYLEKRTRVTVGPNETVDVEIVGDFEPKQLVVDPDRLVLQMKRKNSVGVVKVGE
jgi:ABC-type transport system involved in multi-copper enzyme maturation permease subunit